MRVYGKGCNIFFFQKFLSGKHSDVQHKSPSSLSNPDSSTLFSFIQPKAAFLPPTTPPTHTPAIPPPLSPPGQLETDQRKLLPPFTNSCFISVFLDKLSYHFKGQGSESLVKYRPERWADQQVSTSLKEQFQCG